MAIRATANYREFAGNEWRGQREEAKVTDKASKSVIDGKAL
jgi:hypothetical protein